MDIVTNDRPPYIEFYMREVEDREASIRNGYFSVKQIPFVRVTRAGSKDTLDKNAEDWLSDVKERGRQGMLPDEWHSAFKTKFEAWKKGEEGTAVDGTPIKGWALLSNAQQQMVLRAGYLSVEDLAAASDSEVGNIGIGGITLKQKAVHWLEQAKDGKLVERISALEQAAKDQAKLISDLQAENISLKLRLPSGQKDK